jgi:chemotaxis protein histidine kinase CheA
MAGLVIELINGEKAGATLQLVNKELREAKKSVDKAVVGTDEWRKAMDNVGKAEGNIDKVKKQINSTASASDALKKAWNTLPGAQFFNQIGESFGVLKGGVGGLVSQFGVLKTAIAATGIGALVLVIAGLVQWMSKVEAITNVVKGAWEGATAAWNTFMNAVATGNFDDLGTKMSKAAQEGYNLVQVFDELEDKQRGVDLTNELVGKSLDELMLRSKNVGLSYKERIALLDQADALETKQHQARLQYAGEYLQAVNREVANAQAQGLMNDELADKQLNARKAFIAVQREDIALQEKIANRRAQLEDKQQAANEKAAAAKAKATEEERKAREKADQEELQALQNIQDLKDSLIADAQEREIAEIMTQSQRKIDALIGTSEQRAEQEALLREQELLAIKAVEDKYAADKKATQEAIDAQELAAKQAKADKEKQIAADKAAYEQEMLNIGLDAFQQTVSFGAELLARQAKDEKDARRIKKIGALAEIGINLARELSTNAAYASTLGPGGAAYLALKNPPALIRAAFNTARVLAFRKGGILRGPSHEQGGIGMMVRGRMVAEAEGGEPILTAAVSRSPMLLAAASRINVAAGGRPLMAEGGVTPSAASVAAPFDMQGFEERIAGIMMAAMDKKITTLRVVNNVRDADEKLNEVKQIENEVNV